MSSCPLSLISRKNVRDSYIDAHIPEDWIKLKQIIHTDFADYADAFDKFERNHAIHLYNMFVARSSFLQGYATWLFAVMENLKWRLTHKDAPPFKHVFLVSYQSDFSTYTCSNTQN